MIGMLRSGRELPLGRYYRPPTPPPIFVELHSLVCSSDNRTPPLFPPSEHLSLLKQDCVSTTIPKVHLFICGLRCRKPCTIDTVVYLIRFGGGWVR